MPGTEGPARGAPVWPGWVRPLAVVAVLVCVATLAGLGAPPAASEPNFQAKPSRGGVPLTVQFTNTSNPGDGKLVSFEWTFGDGQGSNQENPIHTYTEAGKYTVTLAVTDDQGHRETKEDRDAIIVEKPGLVAAALPLSRSVQVGAPATAFVSVINVGAITAVGVGIGIHESTAPGGVPGALPAALSFQTTDPSTNQLTGTPGTPVDIPAGGTQSFLVALTPTAELPPTDVRFEIEGTNTSKADTIPGLNTLLLSASTAPVPDIVAVATIQDGTPAVQLPGPSGAAAFAVAVTNVGGIGGSFAVSADTGATPLPLSLAVCQTDPLAGTCTTAVEPTIASTIAAGATATFAVFVTGAGTVSFDPEHHRIFLRFSEGEGAVVRGATSVAVKTQ